MANFLPLKNYMFYCLDQFIRRFDLIPPFLDAGCGRGDVSAYLASRGWQGKAIDFSEIAIGHARRNLASYPWVQIEKKSVMEETGLFQSVFLWDVIEHLPDDELVLHQVSRLLIEGGHVLISVPTNPREWRWDDDFYGHYRRYTVTGIQAQLAQAGLTPLVFWDFTYPVFWAMRRVYTRLKSSPSLPGDKTMRTMESSTVNAWEIPVLSSLLGRDSALWRLIYRAQFLWFKKCLKRGHEMFVLAKK